MTQQCECFATSYQGHRRIVHCKLHAAAPKLLEALKRAAAKMAQVDGEEGLEPSAELEMARDEIESAS